VVEVNAGVDHQGAWSPSTYEKGVQTDAMSEGMSPLGCVHEGRENVRGNRVVAKDVRGIQGVLGVLRAPNHGDVQEEAHDDPKPYHALALVPHGGKSAATAVSG